ncbi:cysteine-rich secretory protein LCCL domain-containing 2-like [Glandiceps talaboti]
MGLYKPTIKLMLSIVADCEDKSTDVCDSSAATPCTVRCPAGCASTSKKVWGDNYYAGDSSLCKAAVHYGSITDEDGGVVLVLFRDGDSAYYEQTRNSITTTSYGAYKLTFLFAGTAVYMDNCEQKPGDHCATAVTICGIRCPPGCASASKKVWGTDDYTADSPVCTAAIHHGSITDKDGGTVQVKFDEYGKTSYTGSTRNGVTSTSFGEYGISYSFAF